jgi:peptidoglycan/xylan/chitin deacetylase (PgdA/CDA1 family)
MSLHHEESDRLRIFARFTHSCFVKRLTVPQLPVPSYYPKRLDITPRYSFNQQVLRAAQPLLYWTGAAPLYARLQQKSGATILMYHSVASDAEMPWIDPRNNMPLDLFERQMQFLAKHRQVISLGTLLEHLEHQQPLERGTVVITFDDGYLNNLTVAAPILAKYNLPAIVYLATGYIEQGKNQWIDDLYSFFRSRTQSRLLLFGSNLGSWDLCDPSQVRSAYFAIAHHLSLSSAEERHRLLWSIQQQLAPSALPPRLTMTWDEVRQLRQDFPHFEIGVHTVNHLDLVAHTQAASEEVQSSLQHIEQELGQRPRYFAFPYNRYNRTAQESVKAAGLKAAVIAGDDPLVRSDADFFALPRMEATRSMTLLRLWTSGAHPDLSKRLLGRTWLRPD